MDIFFDTIGSILLHEYIYLLEVVLHLNIVYQLWEFGYSLILEPEICAVS